MSIIDDARQLAELVKKVGDIELYQKVVALQGEVVELSSRNFEIEKENQDLKKRLQLKGAMHFRAPYFYQEGDDVPFCPNCWESKTVAIHLLTLGHSVRACPTCKTDYEPGSPY